MQAPGVVAVGMHADSEVLHQADGHARALRLVLDGSKLLVEHPLQPAVVVDVVGVGLA